MSQLGLVTPSLSGFKRIYHFTNRILRVLCDSQHGFRETFPQFTIFFPSSFFRDLKFQHSEIIIGFGCYLEFSTQQIQYKGPSNLRKSPAKFASNVGSIGGRKLKWSGAKLLNLPRHHLDLVYCGRVAQSFVLCVVLWQLFRPSFDIFNFSSNDTYRCYSSLCAYRVTVVLICQIFIVYQHLVCSMFLFCSQVTILLPSEIVAQRRLINCSAILWGEHLMFALY
jgi:hypothetical protein